VYDKSTKWSIYNTLFNGEHSFFFLHFSLSPSPPYLLPTPPLADGSQMWNKWAALAAIKTIWTACLLSISGMVCDSPFGGFFWDSPWCNDWAEIVKRFNGTSEKRDLTVSTLTQSSAVPRSFVSLLFPTSIWLFDLIRIEGSGTLSHAHASRSIVNASQASHPVLGLHFTFKWQPTASYISTSLHWYVIAVLR